MERPAGVTGQSDVSSAPWTALLPDVAAFILAGGKSTRMGADKAFVTLEGRTLLARALELARSVTADVRIVGDARSLRRLLRWSRTYFASAGRWEEFTPRCGRRRRS